MLIIYIEKKQTENHNLRRLFVTPNRDGERDACKYLNQDHRA